MLFKIFKCIFILHLKIIGFWMKFYQFLREELGYFNWNFKIFKSKFLFWNIFFKLYSKIFLKNLLKFKFWNFNYYLWFSNVISVFSSEFIKIKILNFYEAIFSFLILIGIFKLCLKILDNLKFNWNFKNFMRVFFKSVICIMKFNTRILNL